MSKVIVVVGVPVRGETGGAKSFVGPSTARTGATRVNTTNSAAHSATSGVAAGRWGWVRRCFDTLMSDLRSGMSTRAEATMLGGGRQPQWYGCPTPRSDRRRTFPRIGVATQRGLGGLVGCVQGDWSDRSP